MKVKAPDLLDTIPRPLLQWIESQALLPEPMLVGIATFYEAAKAAQSIRWKRKLDHFSALHTWSTIALIADERTRKYMAELIHDEAEGLQWTVRSGSATREAMDELNAVKATSPGRLFRQRRDAALKGLRTARENLAALDADFFLRDLITSPDARKFRRAVEQFTHADFSRRRAIGLYARDQAISDGASTGQVMAASFSGLLKFHGNKVPDFSEIILAAEKNISVLPEPSADRHSARSKYLRALFSAMKYSVIESKRIAFVTHASFAVFGTQIEKRDARRLVADLIGEEKKWDKISAEMGTSEEML